VLQTGFRATIEEWNAAFLFGLAKQQRGRSKSGVSA
jgi:hypothetical protein